MARRISVAFGILLVLLVLITAGAIQLAHRRAVMQQAMGSHVTLTRTEPGTDTGAPDAQGSSLKGKAAPAFTLVDLDGKKVTLAQFKGHPVIVNFWATWCGPCKLEMPWFEELYTKYRPQGLVILGLSQDEGTGKEDIAKAAKKIGVSYPILLPDDAVAKAYGGVDYLPETFYVDGHGRIVEESAGAPTKDEIEALIEKTIAAGGQ